MRIGLLSPIASCLALCVATVALPSAAFAQVPPPPTAAAPPAAPAAAEPAAPAVFPPPEDAALSEDAKPDKAKELYIEAEGLAGNGDYTTAAPLYERAYFLVPGKHGFAYKVGYAAYNASPRDCNKADEYLKHYLQYADPAKHPDWQDESKRIIGEIAVSGCATPKAAPAPVDTTTTTEPEPEPTQGEEVVFESAEDRRARESAAEEEERDAGKRSGLFKGGIAMTAIGVVALGAGTATLVMSSKRTNELANLSSSNIAHTSTGFPSGDWACRVPGDPCVADLDKQRRGLNAASYGLLIGGGVLTAAGVTMLVLDMSKKKKKSTAILVPTAGPGYAGVAGSMRF